MKSSSEMQIKAKYLTEEGWVEVKGIIVFNRCDWAKSKSQTYSPSASFILLLLHGWMAIILLYIFFQI